MADDSGHINLRDHLELKSRMMVLEEQIKGSDRALQIAYQEQQRRLDDLNHAHRDAMTKEATFLSVERFEEFLKANALWRETVTVQMAANSGRGAAYSSMLAVALALASLLLNLMKH